VGNYIEASMRDGDEEGRTLATRETGTFKPRRGLGNRLDAGQKAQGVRGGKGTATKFGKVVKRVKGDQSLN